MRIEIQAIFENGVFRPLEPIEGVNENGKVVLTVEPVCGSLSDTQSSNDFRNTLTGVTLDEQGVSPELLEEVRNSIQIALSNVRDSEVMRRAAERMDRARVEMEKRTGIVDVVVPILREIRDEE